DACEEARILPELKITVKEPRAAFRILDESNAEIARIVRTDGKAELMLGDEKTTFLEKKEPSKRETAFLFKDREENTYKFTVRTKEGKEGPEEIYEFVRGRTPFRILRLPSDRFTVVVEDNGPGIVKAQIPRIFGKLLYGSKFGSGKQSRGAQGIGISAALLYSQLTTGKPAKIWSRTSASKPATYMELRIDTTRNEPIIVEEKSLKDGFREHGVSIEFEIEGKWVKKQQSIEEYLRETAAVNPYAKITYEAPDGETVTYPRIVNEIPVPAKAIKPHPHGVEMGMLDRMLKLTDSRTIEGFLTHEFCRIGPDTAAEVRKLANIKPSVKPKEMDHLQVERLWRTMQSYPFMKPPTNCLSPIGEATFREGIKKVYKPEFIASVTRPPSVYRGNPFQIEVVIGYGGELPKQGQAKLLRFANRVPLLYQGSSCAISKSVRKVDWRNYGMEQEGGMPVGPVIVAVHMASVWIPYISEAKEAIDPYPAILKEMRLALQEGGRRLQRFLSGRRRREEATQRRNLFEKYIPEVAESLSKLAEVPKGKIISSLQSTIKKGEIIKQIEEGEGEMVPQNQEHQEKTEKG
ncbi:MAG: DNA topoisomerase VI subunit B, partial [Candidatus Aenigmatarchaeota archaeon]